MSSACRSFLRELESHVAGGELPGHAGECAGCAARLRRARQFATWLRQHPEVPDALRRPELLGSIHERVVAGLETGSLGRMLGAALSRPITPGAAPGGQVPGREGLGREGLGREGLGREGLGREGLADSALEELPWPLQDLSGSPLRSLGAELAGDASGTGDASVFGDARGELGPTEGRDAQVGSTGSTGSTGSADAQARKLGAASRGDGDRREVAAGGGGRGARYAAPAWLWQRTRAEVWAVLAERRRGGRSAGPRQRALLARALLARALLARALRTPALRATAAAAAILLIGFYGWNLAQSEGTSPEPRIVLVPVSELPSVAHPTAVLRQGLGR